VLVALSCFSLLCEEADIRTPNEDFSYNSLLPNYYVYEVGKSSERVALLT